jgi:branched-chain amino acid transport system permease protein
MMRHRLLFGLFVLALIAVPVATAVTGNMFILSLCTRIAILAIAAVGLQLVVGYGNMISLGHALFVGLGAYTLAICTHFATDFGALDNGLLQVLLVIAATAVVAWVTGYVSLRMQGIYFLMITLAFSQMFHLLAVSVPTFGGDDGVTIYSRPWLPLINVDSPYQRYALCAVALVLAVLGMARLVRSRFGLALRASAYNEVRLQSSGYDVHKVRLVAYVIAGVVAGLAGYLLAVHTEFVSPSTMHWTRSGDLVIMIVLGGRLIPGGPVLGACFLVLVEEVASRYTESWPIVLGILLVLFGRYATQGLIGLGKSSKAG